MIQEAALAAISKLQSLPARQAESFAAQFRKGAERLTVAQDKLTESRQLLPPELPEPLIEALVRQFPTSRKRAMTGREAAEEQERDERRQQLRATAKAEEEKAENEHWRAVMVADIQLRHSQSQHTDTKLSSPPESCSESDIELSSLKESSDDDDEPRRSGRVARPTRNKASQLSQEAKAQKKKRESKGKGKTVRKSKLMNTSQLLEEFNV